MAIIKSDNVISMTAAADEIVTPLRVRSLRWVSKAAIAGDDIQLVEGSNFDIAAVIWESVAAGENYIESDSNGGRGFNFRNGVRIATIDSGTLYLYI